ncbi:C-3 sterol dehydrogenase/C-4 decarboxylase-like protein [Westerdykella ornata]|uniref:C-3 sterol dehydrogenase/C-4 decarboxylase-like protein n=1 Tax=Westerdykella ornata TaxID=318751 RepID=A0A6A6J743_WESOR|nr:C-3 sterol dehydrogenase/C-4 decarboxylase-like protein [Westerdykella ornata]KAF2272215.1 C-3 sterol dehydrogenase/C-4 decarboxylase-like protein [Westerdykella ornata]
MADKRNLGTVLVTGGTGWLGSHIVQSLLADQSFNSVVSTVEPGETENVHNRIPGATYHECALSDLSQFTKLLSTIQPRTIIHTVSTDFFSADEAHYRITYHQSKRIITAARQHASVQALVYTSTCEVLALKPSHNTHPVHEDEVPTYTLKSGPHAYARTKSAIDALVRQLNTREALHNTSGDFTDQLLTAVLRTAGLYGPDSSTIRAMLERVNTPNTRFQIGPNALRHDWLYVENCARAHVLAAKALLKPPNPNPGDGEERADGQAFFLTDGKPLPFWDFVRCVWAEAGDANWKPGGPRKVDRVVPFWLVLSVVGVIEWVYWVVTMGRVRPGVSRLTYYYIRMGCWLDIGRARRVLGYEPVVGGTEEGVRRTMEWFRGNGWDSKKEE